jgi:hypothetical protein
VAISLLLPVVRTIQPLALDRAMSNIPRMRDCRFSSVRPAVSPPSRGARVADRARWASSMARVAMSMPRLAARVTASATDPSLE